LKRIAFFVEGLTEQLFIEKLLIEILGTKNISIVKRKMKGGKNSPISITQIGAPEISEDAEYYFLLTDCGGETTVASYIRDQRVSLINKGYLAIFGILDVRPNYKREDIEKLRKNLYFKLPQKDLETKFILSIMEIEAWFLADENHYIKIDSRLTIDFIKEKNNFNPLCNTELIEEPASLLDDIYKTVGNTYGKNKRTIARTVENLDYSNIYFKIPKRIPSLKELIDSIEKYL